MKNLFLDFDETIVATIKAYYNTYCQLYQNNLNFKPAIWENCKEWDLKDICPLVLNIDEIFGNELFFKNLEFINLNTLEILSKINEKYNIIICSIGIPKNIAYKTLWLEKNIPFINKHIMIVNSYCKMDKSIVDMKNGIQIDDVETNLLSSNANFKIIFGKKLPWNENWNGIRCYNWTNLENILL